MKGKNNHREGKIRTFVAILLPEAVKAKIAELVRPLRHLTVDVKWVEEENLHLTLKFLGEISRTEVEKLDALLAGLFARESAFLLDYGGWGVFPSKENPRVLWIGLGGDVDYLRRIQGKVEDICSCLGFPREKKNFHPHITLGRIRSHKNLELLLREAKNTLPTEYQGSFRVEEIYLMESKLSPQGPSYAPLNFYPLFREK